MTSFAEFATKYREVDLKRVNPDLIESEEECDFVLFELNQRIGDMEAQIAGEREQRRPDTQWLIRASRALKAAKAATQIVQARKSSLRKAAEAREEEEYQASFVGAAEELLDVDTFQRICEEVRYRRGG